MAIQHTNPSSTSGHPSYRGRALPRPDEDLEDQGLGFDVQTLLGRRTALKAFGTSALVFTLAACTATGNSSASSSASSSATGTASGEIPDETAGPYPGDGSNGPDILEQSGIVRSDIRSSFGDASGTAAGIPMTIELNIKDMANSSAA
ncbi:MAG: 3,4-dioxygenase subunit beta, partial [Paeniglutamicibacter terrestris]